MSPIFNFCLRYFELFRLGEDVAEVEYLRLLWLYVAQIW